MYKEDQLFDNTTILYFISSINSPIVLLVSGHSDLINRIPLVTTKDAAYAITFILTAIL
jgi:hypothetical protein